MTARKLPPYARHHADRLHDPKTSVWVATGDGAWRWARRRIEGPGWSWSGPHYNQLAIVAHPEDDPAELDWRCLAGHDPVILVRVGHVEGSYLRTLVRAMMRDGVQRVLGANGDLFIAEVHHG